MEQPNNQSNPNTTIIWIVVAVIITLLLTSIIVGGIALFWVSRQADFMHSGDYMEEMMDNMHDEMGESDRNHDADRDDSVDADTGSDSLSPPATPTGSETLSVDSTWDRYINHDVGFSIDIPNQFYHYYGAMCSWDGSSYRPAGDFVSTQVFTATDHMYISSQNFYDMSGETVTDGLYTYSQCDEVTNSLTALDNNQYSQQQSWRFVWQDNIDNDADLEDFLQNRYGSGCSLGSQDPTAQSGMFDVKIVGDGLDLGSTLCPVNYATVVRYSPANHLVVAWNLGQAITFPSDSSWMNVYDQDMVDSFRFE